MSIARSNLLTAVVTGSTGGIGLGIARSLARTGIDIVLNGFGGAGEIESLRQSLEKEYAVRVRYHGADMRRPEEIRALGDFAGKVDILINNAGIQHVARLENFPDDQWADIIAINLSAAFHASKAVLPGMQQRKFGRIVNIASVHGLVASVEKSAYVAAKHGLVGLTKVIALENATQGITCNAICPGYVLTPLVQKQIDARAEKHGLSRVEASKSLLTEKQPALDFATPDQIGEMVVYLCSPAAARITGTALPIDGGWTAQ